jgi:hypothetical protein
MVGCILPSSGPFHAVTKYFGANLGTITDVIDDISGGLVHTAPQQHLQPEQLPNNHLTISRQLRRIRTRLARVQYFIRPKAAFVGGSLLWGTVMWMRSCAICKALMKKLRLSDSVRYECGWEWQGHMESPAVTP